MLSLSCPCLGNAHLHPGVKRGAGLTRCASAAPSSAQYSSRHLAPQPCASLGFCHVSFVSSCPQVNLKTGVPPDSNNETCTAGAGSLLVEFGILSRLLGDSTFEWVARRAVKALWSLRSNDTGLLGVVAPRPRDWICLAPVLLCSRGHSRLSGSPFSFVTSENLTAQRVALHAGCVQVLPVTST